jgi:hypothetical protein
LASKSKRFKIFLLADLVFLAAVIPGYFYVDSQISKPAEFQLSNLILDSDWVKVGDPIYVSVTVTNIGDQSGNRSVTLTIDDIPKETKMAQLEGGETLTLTFMASEAIEGNHTVIIEDLTASFKVSQEAPIRKAELRLTNLVTSRKEVQIGDPITVSVTATNIGDETGEFSLELFINDAKRETKTIQLNGDETTSVQYEIVENTEGNYEVRLGTLTTSFTVTSEAQTAKPAEFKLSELTINPSSIISGESVTISVKVTNIGEITGNHTVDLEIDGTIRNTKTITVGGQASVDVEFKTSESSSGSFNVKIGELTGSFDVEDLVPASPNTKLYGMIVNPYEVWGGETVNIRTKADNLANESAILHVRLVIKYNGTTIETVTKTYTMQPGETEVPVEFSVTAGEGPSEIKVVGYRVELINLGNQDNTLVGYFQIAPNGYHTISINRSGGGSTPMIFIFNGETLESPWSALLPIGNYSLSTDRIVQLQYGVVEFDRWNDGVTTESRTINLNKQLSVLANYIVISGYASCPSLYTWNGTNYSYITEVSNAGWLGYIDYITEKGDIVFGGGNPWDHVKLDETQLKTKTENGTEYYDIVLFQQWNEIFYVDTAYLVVVDHPNNKEAYSTMVNYVNRGFFGKIYTIDEKNLLTPISATNGKGEDMLPQISELDGIFTPASNGVLSPSWDNITLNQLTLDLGNLSNAEEIKLVINGMVDWGPAQPYYDWIDLFKDAAANGLVPNGTQINPPSYLEIMDAEGNWVLVPQNRTMPIPGDYVPRTFSVNMTDLFPANINEYKIRITNFWNVTFDYIGIDVTPQENITITKVMPVATLEPLDYATTTSNASGYFTKYGDITELLLEADDEFVIGIQGDTISLRFPTTDLPKVEDGKERSFFLFVASWFKDHIGNWGYEFDFTVEPLPFQNMSGFPYPPTENHPDTSFLDKWNTRAINIP